VKQIYQYQTHNWNQYNMALIQRGNISFWIDQETLDNWRNEQKTGKKGASNTYNDVAILLCLTFRVLWKMPFRQTQGFVTGLFSMMKIDLKVPHYTTLCRRMPALKVPLLPRISNEPIHVVIDSTGVKIYGEGEWKVRQHGKDKRRTWYKIHIAFDEATHQVLSCVTTDAAGDDRTTLPDVLADLPADIKIRQASLDGIYDTKECRDLLHAMCDSGNAKGVARVTIPPRKNAVITERKHPDKPPLERDEDIRYIRRHGRAKWKRESGYSRRSLAETGMSRIKGIFGSRLSSRSLSRGRVEANIRCQSLNKMTSLGMPQTERVMVNVSKKPRISKGKSVDSPPKK
jgi:Transposase DDE domain